jgi:hypothetical protein
MPLLWFLLMISRGSVSEPPPHRQGVELSGVDTEVDSEPIDLGAKLRISIQPALHPPHLVGVRPAMHKGLDLAGECPGSSRPLFPRLVNTYSGDALALKFGRGCRARLTYRIARAWRDLMIFWRRTRGPESRVLDPGSRRPVAGSGADLQVSNHLASRSRARIDGPDANRGPRPTSVPVLHDSGSSFQWSCRRERRNS